MSNSPPQPETHVNVFDFLREAFEEAGYGPNGVHASDDDQDEDDAEGEGD